MEKFLEQLARTHDLGINVDHYDGVYVVRFVDLNNDSVINEGAAYSLMDSLENAISAVRREDASTS